MYRGVLLVVVLVGATSAQGTWDHGSLQERASAYEQTGDASRAALREHAASAALFGGFRWQGPQAAGVFVDFTVDANGSLRDHAMRGAQPISLIQEIRFSCSGAVAHVLGAEAAWTCGNASWHFFDDPLGTWFVRAGDGLEVVVEAAPTVAVVHLNQTRMMLQDGDASACLCVWGNGSWDREETTLTARLGEDALLRFQAGLADSGLSPRLRLRDEAFVVQRLAAEGRVADVAGQPALLAYEYAARLRLAQSDERVRLQFDPDAGGTPVVDLILDGTRWGRDVRVHVDGSPLRLEQDQVRLWQGPIQEHAYHVEHAGLTRIAVRLADSLPHVLELVEERHAANVSSWAAPLVAVILLACGRRSRRRG